MMAAQPGCTVVGQISGAKDISGDVDVFTPDVIVWDLGWDPTTALESLTELDSGSPPVLALLPDSSFAEEAWLGGVRGLLLRDADPATIVAALRAVAQGLATMDREMGSLLAPNKSRSPTEPLASLTPRELEVLQLLAEGLTNKEISYRLGISEHTVKFHVNAILGKLDAQSRTEAVTQAMRLGLILL